ncbi:hypothetical protein Fleli_2833 [Bernardetia litoralis DSM 6794]|uniref:Pyrrolo-quinoline quinone repeat domain-containing protein n=1 Tax=Bernardetia litoralis (strain ATCC 23117 / DSM 6794 / NBRC 15988 / NCIMB 1366 / Fx l1 / Sio-4) TaxID=880071 RepID=I4AMK1_BERLS|nr:PQQ-binding-like beta-propeller repeat protein [Bernardetia litoralis]AFM05186.1 hypothetical protein Fleli_2833 [Bernardetia litoralis DSM 6794]
MKILTFCIAAALSISSTVSFAVPFLTDNSNTKPTNLVTTNLLNKTNKLAYKAVGDKGFDAANTIIKCNDGNFILLGRTDSYGAGDMNMSAIKVDASGNIIWNKNYGAEESEEGYTGLETTDGGFIFAGYSDSYGAGSDIKDGWIVRTDAKGSRIWDKTFGSNQSIDEIYSIVQTDEGNYMVLMNSIPIATGKSDIILLEIDDKGETIWKKSFGGKSSEQAKSLAKTEDGYLIAGHVEGEMMTKWDMLLIHVDKKGNKKWEKTYGGGDNEMANVVKVMPSGNILIAGYSYTYAEGSHDAWVVCADKNGKKLWDKNFGGLSTDEIFDILVTDNSEIILIGYTDIYKADEYGNNVSPLSNEIMINKLDTKGNEIWKRTLGGNKDQVAKAGAIADDGSFVLAGYTNENIDTRNVDMLILKVSADGK